MTAMELRTPEERTRYTLAVVISVLAWLGLLVSIVGAIYGIMIAAFIAAAHALFLAHLRNSGVRVGPDQLPALWRRIEAASTQLGLDKAPETYVLQSNGVLNAFATKFLGRCFVILHSDLLDACEQLSPSLDDPEGPPTELDFILGHEVGHIACNHLNWLLLPARIVPLLGAAYSRACEYTCDRCGHAVVRDLDVASRALAILGGGPTAVRHMDLGVYTKQRQASGGFWASVAELNATHPFLPKRLAALREWQQPGSMPAVPRSALAYPLAPLFPMAGGGSAGLVVVMMVGVMAAIAIPQFKKYADQAKLQQERLAAGAATASDPLQARVPEPAVADADFIRGDLFDWSLRKPSQRWRLMSAEQTHRQNAFADRWLVRPDADAHVLVIAERAADDQVDGLVESVLANAKAAATQFELIERQPLEIAGVHGVRLHTKSQINGVAIESLVAVFKAKQVAYQVMGFSAQNNFETLRPELMAAIESFTVP